MSMSQPINQFPQKSSSTRQADLLRQFAETRGKARVQEVDSQIDRANAAPSAVEISMKGALTDKVS